MEIPAYPESKPLEIGDKPLLDRLYTNAQPRISEMTFAGLFLFRRAHDYKITTIADSIVLLGRGYDGADYFLPPLDGDIATALKTIFNDGLPLYGADDLFVDMYISKNSVQIAEQRDSADYLYLREKLATLPGSSFHKKKNRISYFTARHDYSVVIYSKEHLEGCLNLLDKWQQSYIGEIGSSQLFEVEANAEALEKTEELDLEGVVVMVNDTVAAFALGERLNKDTAVCHFEKADPFTEGLYQLVNREFARMLFTDCRYLNREQDLGDAGLRKAKLSYQPIELVTKYLVFCS